MSSNWGRFFRRKSRSPGPRSAIHSAIESLESRVLLTTRYVDVNSPGPTHDGTTWDTAYVDLQLALASAISGDEVRVADGMYKPTSGTDRTISFQLINNVGVEGGYAGSGAIDPDARNTAMYTSILSGDIGLIGDISDNSYHVVNEGNLSLTALLDGFTVIGGNANGTTSATNRGGGLYAQDALFTVSNCVFTGNSGRFGAGGWVDFPLASTLTAPIIKDCVFLRNTAANVGGGLYISGSVIAIGSAFYGNTAEYGGGVHMVGGLFQPQNCVFAGNSATIAGGGIWTRALLMSVNCTVVANSSPNAAGIYWSAPIQEPHSPVYKSIANWILWGNGEALGTNQAQISGPTITLVNSNFQGGVPVSGTGNVDIDPQFHRIPSAGPDSTWGTIDDDYGDLRLQAGSPCIDAGNNAFVPAGISVDVSGANRFTDVLGVNDPGVIVDMGAYEATGTFGASAGSYLFDAPMATVSNRFNGDLDPATLQAGDLTLVHVNSGNLVDVITLALVSYDPATRAATWMFASGLPDGNYSATLAAGSVNVLSGTPMGAAYTFDFFVLAADANRDRKVDVNDLVILANNWLGTGKTFSQGDFNYDGVVNQTDLGIMATRWQVRLDPPAPPAPPIPTSAARRPATRTPTRVIELVQ